MPQVSCTISVIHQDFFIANGTLVSMASLGSPRSLRTEAFPSCRIFKELHRSQDTHVTSEATSPAHLKGVQSTRVTHFLYTAEPFTDPSQLGPLGYNYNNPHPIISHRDVLRRVRKYKSTIIN